MFSGFDEIMSLDAGTFPPVGSGTVDAPNNKQTNANNKPIQS